MIKDTWMKQGARISAIGADAKGKLELETSLTKRAKVVVDDITRASHSGKINVSISEGSISPEDVYAKLRGSGDRESPRKSDLCGGHHLRLHRPRHP